MNKDNILQDLKIEQLGVSDTEYTIISCHFSNGDVVNCGDILLEYETSKTVMEIAAEFEGYFYTAVKEGDTVTVGSLIGVVTNEQGEYDFTPEIEKEVVVETASKSSALEKSCTLRFSKKAEALIERLGSLRAEIPYQEKIVTETDLKNILASRVFFIPTWPLNDENRCVLIGAGGMVETVISAARKMGTYMVVGILDDQKNIGDEFLGVPVIGREDMASDLLRSGVTKAFISFASPSDRKKRYDTFLKYKSARFEMINIIHPKAVIEESVSFGEGNLILENSVIGANCNIGDLNYINVGSLLCHHVTLKDNNHIAPGAILAGGVSVDNHCLIGMAATTVSNCCISSDVTVNNGAAVVGNIGRGEVIRK